MTDMASRVIGFSALIIGVQALTLYLLGQPAICECGYVKAWEGVVQSGGNSQHLADWYTFSHVLHGIIFYAVLWYFFPRMPVSIRFLCAIGIEAGWEVFENTPLVIDHYRQQALAQGYVGDSILNSVSDTVAMIVGFMIAWRLPIVAVIALALAVEVFTGVVIHDGLLLNIIGFVYTPDWIAQWQTGG